MMNDECRMAEAEGHRLVVRAASGDTVQVAHRARQSRHATDWQAAPSTTSACSTMTTPTHAAPIPTTTPRHRRQWLVWLAFSLAIAAYMPYCGLLIVPAGLCWLASIMGHRPVAIFLLTWPILGLRLLALGFHFPELPPFTPACIHRPYANYVLAGPGLPPLPPAAARVRISSSGGFAHHIWLVFDAPESAADAFRHSLPGAAAEPRRLGPHASKFGDYEEMDSLRQSGSDTDMAAAENRIIWSVPDGGSSGWYQLRQTTVGWYASSNDVKSIVAWQLCYDETLGRVYFHWSID